MVEYCESNYNGIEYLFQVVVNYVEELRTALLETQVNLDSILSVDNAGTTFGRIDDPPLRLIGYPESGKIDDMTERTSKAPGIITAYYLRG